MILYSGEQSAALQELIGIQIAVHDLLSSLEAGSDRNAAGPSGVGIVVYDRLIVVKEHVRMRVSLSWS